MKKSTWLRVLLTATLVIAGGALIAQAEETHTVKVKVQKGDSQTVDVFVDGTTEVMSLEDPGRTWRTDFVYESLSGVRWQVGRLTAPTGACARSCWSGHRPVRPRASIWWPTWPSSRRTRAGGSGAASCGT